MTPILFTVTVFAVALIVLDRLPRRWLTGNLADIVVEVRKNSLLFRVACSAFLFEWQINGLDFNRRGRVTGMRLMVDCDNWWSLADGDAAVYRRVVVDSREWTAPTRWHRP